MALKTRLSEPTRAGDTRKTVRKSEKRTKSESSKTRSKFYCGFNFNRSRFADLVAKFYASLLALKGDFYGFLVHKQDRA